MNFGTNALLEVDVLAVLTLVLSDSFNGHNTLQITQSQHSTSQELDANGDATLGREILMKSWMTTSAVSVSGTWRTFQRQPQMCFNGP
jgi:hypothetical protein